MLDFLKKILEDFRFFWDFLDSFKLLKVLLNVTEVTTKHHKKPKISTNSFKSFFLPKKTLVRKPKPSAGGRSKPT